MPLKKSEKGKLKTLKMRRKERENEVEEYVPGGAEDRGVRRWRFRVRRRCKERFFGFFRVDGGVKQRSEFNQQFIRTTSNKGKSNLDFT